MVGEFKNNDQAYLAWIKANRHDGFVINTRKGISPSYVILHRASCNLITELKGKAEKGGFTERGYRKVCANTISDLVSWIKGHIRADGKFSKLCAKCKPE